MSTTQGRLDRKLTDLSNADRNFSESVTSGLSPLAADSVHLVRSWRFISVSVSSCESKES